jgi:CheY-like chemotaxis protein
MTGLIAVGLPIHLDHLLQMPVHLTAAGGAAGTAAQAIEAEAFDVVLMDVQMPDMDGLEATRRLRQGEAGPINQATAVFALTAGATAGERAACRAAGMNDFIAKPVSRPELIGKLAAVPRRPTP